MAPQTFYEILGVAQDASPDEVTRAYRQRALAEHPDKGGDKDRFDELAKAYNVLDDVRKRGAYNEELGKQRERAELVVDYEQHPAYPKKKEEPLREKTAPTPGSKRQGKMRNCAEPGKCISVAHEWKGMGSAANFLKMIEDANVTPEMKTEKLMDQYAKLPSGKEKKQQWVGGLRGQEKQALKVMAKEREKAAMEKASKWLSNGPVKSAPARPRPAPAARCVAVGEQSMLPLTHDSLPISVA